METFAGAVLGKVAALGEELRASSSLAEARLIGIENSQKELMEALRTLLQPRPAPLYMSVAQAAKRYSLSEFTMYEIIKMPDSPVPRRVGTKWLLPIREYDQFIDSQQPNTTSN